MKAGGIPEPGDLSSSWQLVINVMRPRRREDFWRLRVDFDSMSLRMSGGDDSWVTGFFDLYDRYDALSPAGEPLERFSVANDLSQFWTALADHLLETNRVG